MLKKTRRAETSSGDALQAFCLVFRQMSVWVVPWVPEGVESAGTTRPPCVLPKTDRLYGAVLRFP